MTEHTDPRSIANARFAHLSTLPLTRISGQSAAHGGKSGFWSSLREVLRHREMLDLMVRRDLKARYKDSSLGFVWSLIRPLVQLAVYYVVLGQFLGAARGIPEFAIFIFAGLTAYGLFSEIIQSGVRSIIDNTGLIKKIYLPREIFPLASIGSALFNFAMQLVILLAATVAVGAFPFHIEILYAVGSLAILLTYGCALALLLSATNVYLRDIQYLVDVGLMLLMWASPVVYAWKMVQQTFGPGWLLELYTNNPLTLAVLGFQQAFWLPAASEPYPSDLPLRMLIAVVAGLVLILVCHQVFRRLQGNFAQEL